MSNDQRDDISSSNWSQIISSISTPLRFMGLVVLISEVILGILAYRSEPQVQTIIVTSMIALLFLCVISVVVLAIFRPEALAGLRPSEISVMTSDTTTEQTGPVKDIEKKELDKQKHIDPKLVSFIPPLNPTRFRIISLPKSDPPHYFVYPYVPTGYILPYGTPFFLLPVVDETQHPVGHLVVDLQPSQSNIASHQRIDINIDDLKALHFLISAGHGWRLHEGVQFLHRRIGYLRINFNDNSEQRVDLILGKHLREWSFGNNPNLVTEIDQSLVKPAWLSHDGTKRFDILTIPIENSPKHVDSIEIVAEFEDDHPGKLISTPAIILSAITVEREG